MSDMIALTVDEAAKQTNVLYEAKIDGARHTWTGSELLSERNIDRSDRFPHIVAELKTMPWQVRGEVAVPFGNILTLNKKENWHLSRFYAFNMYEWQGQDTRDAGTLDNRLLIEKAYKQAPRFKNLRYPFKFPDFSTAWARVLKHNLEGVVLKDLNSNREYKCKYYKEEKLPIVGHVPGSTKGSFIIERKGVTSKVSGTSEAFVEKYKALLTAGKAPYAEIEYLFLTDNGVPFQPRLRNVDTLKNLQSKPK
jgi:ATP-dependent DNA ligase